MSNPTLPDIQSTQLFRGDAKEWANHKDWMSVTQSNQEWTAAPSGIRYYYALSSIHAGINTDVWDWNINEVWKLKSSKEFTLSFIKIISFNKELIIFLMCL
jgi:hypothetical protein